MKMKRLMIIISSSLIAMLLTGCSITGQPVNVLTGVSTAVQRTPVVMTHVGTVTSASSDTADVQEYETILGADVITPKGYVANVTNAENGTMDAQYVNGEKQTVGLRITTLKVSQTVSSPDAMLEVGKYLLNDVLNSYGYVSNDIPAEDSGYYVGTLELMNANSPVHVTYMSPTGSTDVILILCLDENTDAYNTMIDNIKTKNVVKDVFTLPASYLRVDGGYYYNTKQIQPGRYLVYAYYDAPTTIQIFAQDGTLKYTTILSQTDDSFSKVADILLEDEESIYVSNSCAFSKSTVSTNEAQ